MMQKNVLVKMIHIENVGYRAIAEPKRPLEGDVRFVSETERARGTEKEMQRIVMMELRLQRSDEFESSVRERQPINCDCRIIPTVYAPV